MKPLLIALALTLALPSCAFLKSPATVLDALTKALDEVDAIVHALDAGVQPWLLAQPVKVQQTYADAMRRFWLVDDAARRGKATIQDVVAAEQDLVRAVQKLGAPVRQAGEKPMAAPDAFTIPRPQ